MFPRLVEFPQLPMQSKLNYWDSDCDRRHVQAVRPDSAIPLALLGVNKESSSEMSYVYRRSFGFTKPECDKPLENSREDILGVIFNVDIDTLFLHKEDAEDLAKYCTDGLDRLRYAAVFLGRNINGGTLITNMFPALGRLFMKYRKLERLSLCLFDPYSRLAKASTITEQDELRRRSFERSLLNYWDWYTFDGKHSGQMRTAEVQKRWRDVVRVQYISQLREERGMAPDQRPHLEVDW